MSGDIPTITVHFERVEIKPGPRKLKGTWKCELGEDVWLYSYTPWYVRVWEWIKKIVSFCTKCLRFGNRCQMGI